MPKPGQIFVIKGKPEVVVAAPHGRHDHWTGRIVSSICLSTGFSGVIAEDFIDKRSSLRVNVNRPMEGAGVNPEEETFSELASSMHRRYQRSVFKACDGNLKNYVEIHGNKHKELKNRIEVAVKSLSLEKAKELSQLYQTLTKDKLSQIPSVDLWIEGLNPIEKKATASKLFGVLSLSDRALHFELPEIVRLLPKSRKFYTRVLSRLISFWSLQS
jgi:hypothetical protein